ncbi:MAG TPA: hypothetical protein VEB66_01920 [Opitutaceae bacterium]|nr:hypothetical protein [Opitutaceae bacterium]
MSAGAELHTLVKKHPIGAAAVLLSVACGVLLYFRSSTITTRTTDASSKADEAAKMQANITNSAGLAEQTEKMREAAKEVEARLVRRSQLAINLQYFYKMESDSGVKILDVRQGEPGQARNAPRTTYTGIPYNVSVQGTFAQTLSFLKRLENGRHFCRFMTVTYTKAGSSDRAGGGDLMNLSINLELLGQP